MRSPWLSLVRNFGPQTSRIQVVAAQADVDSFDCNVISGALAVQGPGVESLDGLAPLRRVEGSMSVLAVSSADLDGLENLEYVGGALHIAANPSITTEETFDALDRLRVAGALDVTYVDGGGTTHRAGLCERACDGSTAAPAAGPPAGCGDDRSWHKRDNPSKNCDFVGRAASFPRLCRV